MLFGACIQGGVKNGGRDGDPGGGDTPGARSAAAAVGGGRGGGAGGSRRGGAGGRPVHANGSGLSPMSSAGLAGGAGGGGGASSFSSSASFSKAIGATHAPITRQGYLYKKGKSGLKNWQKRWFVLEGSKLIW